MNAIFLRSGSAHVDNVITKRCSKQSHGCSCQGRKATNHTVTLRNLPNPASGTYTSARRNSPEPASGTYNSTHRNSPEPSGTCLRNLHQHTPELSGTFRNLQPSAEPTPAHTRTLWNLPEPASGTYTSNTPELCGTFRNLPPEPTPAHTGTLRNLRNLPPEPTPAHTGTLRNLPEPASGTYTSTHWNLPEFQNLPPEPAPATRTGTHRSLSGLKTPLAYAVGEKRNKVHTWKLGALAGTHCSRFSATTNIKVYDGKAAGCAWNPVGAALVSPLAPELRLPSSRNKRSASCGCSLPMGRSRFSRTQPVLETCGESLTAVAIGFKIQNCKSFQNVVTTTVWCTRKKSVFWGVPKCSCLWVQVVQVKMNRIS